MAAIRPAAVTAASLLARGRFTATGGQPAVAELTALVDGRLPQNSDLQKTLQQARARPDDPMRVAALAQVLVALGGADPAFARKLSTLVVEAQEVPGVGGLVTKVYGHAQVGKLVTIGQADEIHVHLPAEPPPTMLDRLPATRQVPLVANLPPRNPVFTGREDLLERLHASLHPGPCAAVVQAQALHGLGGVGKTQLALEYAHRHAGDYDLIWWTAAEPPAAIPAQLVALARRLGIPEAADQAETIGVLWDSLRQRDRWLLIFDNAEHSADLNPWWPPNTGRMLVTSRTPAWSGLAATIEVDVLPRIEAVAFLSRRLGHTDAMFEALAGVLGDLPLALEQAAAYVDETAASPAEYLDLLGDRAPELFTLGHPVTTEQTIATTWSVALGHLREQAPAAEELLVLWSFLAADDIPRALPTQHLHVLPERLAATMGDPLVYQQTIAALRRLALVSISGDGQSFSVHRLVQAVVRHRLDTTAQQQWAAVAVRLVRAAFPKAAYNPDAWPIAMRLLAHALIVTDHPAVATTEPQATVSLLQRVANYLWARAEHALAQPLAERALATSEACLGLDHPDTARSLNSLGLVRYDQGELDGARVLHQRALAIREACLGPDHPDTADSLNNLGMVLRDQGDLDGARVLYRRALAIREAHLGPDHPDTAWSLQFLGVVVHDQGDLDGARRLHQRTLEIREAHFGPDHPDTAWSVHSLGRVIHDEGDLAGARSLHERALRIREARLGPDHPDTARSLANLASVLQNQGELDRARSLFERALAIREARLGPHHPRTALSLLGLAGVLRDQGELDSARTLYQRALAIWEACLGADHPWTASSLQSLGLVAHAQADLDTARNLHERALAIFEARLGPDHPDTARSLHSLGLVVHDQGDLDGAHSLHERALQIRETHLGPSHPDIASSLDSLALILHEQHDLAGARPLLERALAIREARLGSDHPQTVQTRRKLAATPGNPDNQ
jgi:tetratricopeptide (TPR) repeat protein